MSEEDMKDMKDMKDENMQEVEITLRAGSETALGQALMLLEGKGGLLTGVSLFYRRRARDGDMKDIVETIRSADVASVRRILAACEGRLAELSGAALRLAEDQGRGISAALRDCPPYGAVIRYTEATGNYGYTDWYPSLEAAKAALLQIAQREGQALDRDGLGLDVTARGCNYSGYTIRKAAVSHG